MATNCVSVFLTKSTIRSGVTWFRKHVEK